MNVSGEFTTAASPAALRGLSTAPDRLATVPTLRDVTVGADCRLRAVFTPATPLGPFPLATTIATEHADDACALLRVTGRRGAHAVDVDLRLTFTANGAVTVVRWTADLRLGGAVASVGQRVARDVARRAIAGVLESAAALPAAEA